MNFFILIEGLLKIPFIPRDEGSGVLPPTEVVSCRATSARFEPAGLDTIPLRHRIAELWYSGGREAGTARATNRFDRSHLGKAI